MSNKRLYKSSVIICCAVCVEASQNILILTRHWYVWRGSSLPALEEQEYGHISLRQL